MDCGWAKLSRAFQHRLGHGNCIGMFGVSQFGDNVLVVLIISGLRHFFYALDVFNFNFKTNYAADLPHGFFRKVFQANRIFRKRFVFIN